MFDFFRRRSRQQVGAVGRPTPVSDLTHAAADQSKQDQTTLPPGQQDPFMRPPGPGGLPASTPDSIPIGSTRISGPPAHAVVRSIVPKKDQIEPEIKSTVGDDTRTHLIPDYEALWYAGPDGTTRSISVPVAPWSAICCLKLQFGSRVFRGTGWFIGPRTIATAAHNLYDRDLRRAVDKIVILAGKIGPGNGPFGEATTTLFDFDVRYKSPVEREAAPFDFGAIFMPDDWLGSFVRHYFKFAAVNPASNIGEIQVAGYPGDGGDRLLYAKGRMEPPGPDTRMIVHDVDTEKGESGAPIYHYHPTTGYTVVGIHTDGFGLHPNRNAGVRITPELKSKLQNWIAHPGARLDENIPIA